MGERVSSLKGAGGAVHGWSQGWMGQRLAPASMLLPHWSSSTRTHTRAHMAGATSPPPPSCRPTQDHRSSVRGSPRVYSGQGRGVGSRGWLQKGPSGRSDVAAGYLGVGRLSHPASRHCTIHRVNLRTSRERFCHQLASQRTQTNTRCETRIARLRPLERARAQRSRSVGAKRWWMREGWRSPHGLQ